ncbi:hypothetical protein CHS0354_025757 [Potamilus streckersoni]|uniref:Uncharacterized protein n=1 Tax=Potamilus streckersoni TaxID=2493646 RepID=A0AAE0RV67_9BIVA|nr:hypothetical protein CHS0354_025757 [Potamilus streckersoni]
MTTKNIDSLSVTDAVCPICFQVFTSPRQLPCMHAFCEKCLQDYVATHGKENGGVAKELVCPVCRTVTSQYRTGKHVGIRISLLPRNAILITEESKMNFGRICDGCQYIDESNVAEGFCIVCVEGLCSTCSMVHRKTKSTRDHKIISVNELTNTLENRVRFSEGFGCPDHQEKHVEYYCQMHDAVCCADCFLLNHTTCSDVKRFNADLPNLMSELRPEVILGKMKKIEEHLRTFVKDNESNICEVETKVNQLVAEIQKLRQMINKKLDDLETLVNSEGDRIYKQEMIKRQEENRQCQSLIHAVRNSQIFLDTVLKYGTDTQIFLVCKRSMAQLKSYSDQVKENYEEIESITVDLEVTKLVQDILSLDLSSIAKLESSAKRSSYPCFAIIDDNIHSITSKSLRESRAKLDKVVEIRSVGKNVSYYTGIVLLPSGNVLLADYNNKTCCLYDSSYGLVSSYTLSAEPVDMCLVDHHEVAVTLYGSKCVQFLSIRHHTIKDTEMMTTRYQVGGLVAVSAEELVVSGPTDNSMKCYWSLVNRREGEKYYREFVCPSTLFASVALNTANTRIFISIYYSNKVLCFGLTDGKQYYSYTSKDLKYPYGTAVDREDNVYVVGNGSHNIHKLSADGTPLQIVTSGVPQYPLKISFDKSREHFTLTTGSDLQNPKLYMFVHD